VPLVLDASIAASWAFDDENEPIANLALARIASDVVFAPSLIWFELRNTLIVGEPRGGPTEMRTAKYLEWFGRMGIKIDSAPVETQLFALARRHRLTFYDAAYLELASRLGAPLATLDKKLAAAALAESLPLLQAP